MTAEEVFCGLFDKYKDFNWRMVPFTQSTGKLVEELKKELGDSFSFPQEIYAVAKCDSNDGVLYVTNDGKGNDIYYIFQLNYSGLPMYKKFLNILEVKEYIEQLYTENYL